MVSPVLHVLPLTIRSAYFPMIALLLRAFRDLWSSPRCWKLIGHQVFSQGMVGKKFFACGALNSSSPIACGGPGRAIFQGANFAEAFSAPTSSRRSERAAAAAATVAVAVVRPHPPRSRPRQCHVRQQPGGQERCGAAMECAPRFDSHRFFLGGCEHGKHCYQGRCAA